MTAEKKIEKYVKNITKSETYGQYLTEAARFGYNLAEDKIKALEAALKAYEDIGATPIDEDFEDYY